MNKTKVFRGKVPFSSYNTFEEMIEGFMGDNIDHHYFLISDDFFNYLSDLIDYSLAGANAAIMGVSVPRNTMRGYMRTLQTYINADRTVYCLCANDISTAFYNREAFVTPYLMGNFYHTEDQSYVQVTDIANECLVCSDGIYRYAFGVDIGRPIVPSLGGLPGKALLRTFTFTDRIKQDNGMYEELMQDYQTTCDSLATAHEDIRTASNRNNELSHAIDALKVQLEEKDKTIAKLVKAYNTEKDYAIEMDINLTQWRNTIKNQKAIIEQYQNSEATYDEIIKKQKEAIDHYQNAVKKYAEHVNALESDLSMSKDEANCLRMKTDALLERVNKLREKSLGVQSKRLTLRSPRIRNLE